jgi:2',3'-cyclic-nucleotide 2'-phosphodiesterase (5'-nucleotidase family)
MAEIAGDVESGSKAAKQQKRALKKSKHKNKMDKTTNSGEQDEQHGTGADLNTRNVKPSQANAEPSKGSKPKKSDRRRSSTKSKSGRERHKHSETVPTSPRTDSASPSNHHQKPAMEPISSSAVGNIAENKQQTDSRNEKMIMKTDRRNSNNSSAGSFRVGFDGSVTPSSSLGSKDHEDTVAEATNEMMEVGAAVRQQSEAVKLDTATTRISLKTLPSFSDMNKEIIVAGGNQRRCFKTRAGFLCFLFSVLAVIAAGVVVPLLLLGNDSEHDDGMLRLSEYPKNQVISEVPVNLCNEWVPGQGKSELCAVQQTVAQGGDVCNLLAQAVLNSTASAKIAIVNAGVCIGDISAPNMTAGDISNAIAAEQLYTVEMSGSDLEKLLEQAMEATFGASADSTAYPYAAGLRFDVDSHLEFGNRANKVEVIVDLVGDFRPINYRKFYTVVTTKDLASGGNGYSQFGATIDNWRKPTPYQTVDAFLNYAAKDANWWVPKAAAYSTQRFVPPDTEPKIASVPNDICLGWTPDGTSTSSVCSQGTAVVGGGACNLVAWALLDQNWKANIAILNGGLCASEVLSGDFTLSSATALIPNNPSLVTVELSGTQVVALLEEAMDALVGATPGEDAYNTYPFCSALRFNVNTMAGKGERLSSLEFFTASNRWVPLDLNNTFNVLTTSDLAGGNNPGYGLFREADSSTLREVRLGSVDTLLKFANDWEILFEPPKEKHSTQAFT